MPGSRVESPPQALSSYVKGSLFFNFGNNFTIKIFFIKNVKIPIDERVSYDQYTYHKENLCVNWLMNFAYSFPPNRLAICPRGLEL